MVEPGPVVMRDGGVKLKIDGAQMKEEVKAEMKEATSKSSASTLRGLRIGPDLPLEGVRTQEKKGADKPPTWSPQHSNDEVFSTKDLLTETFQGIVDVTASAVTAAYEGVSSALNSADKAPKVVYQNDRVIISQNDDRVDGIPRPLQVG